MLLAGVRNAAGVTYVNRGAVAQWSPTTGRFAPLDDDAAQGAAVADFNADGDAELFLGRVYNALSPRNFYQNKGTTAADPPTHHWIGIRLRAPDIGNNRNGIGARVKLEAPDVNPTLVQGKVVDGGSARGLQGNSTLVYGLGSFFGSVKATVTWTDGHVQVVTFSSGQLDQVHEIVDDHYPGYVDQSYTLSLVVKPGGLMDLTAVLDSPRSSDPADDRLRVTDSAGAGCISVLAEIGPATPGVSFTVVPKVGGGYRRTLLWADQPCTGGCTYFIEAISSYAGRESKSPKKKIVISSCLQ